MEALDRRLAESTTQGKLLAEVGGLFELDGPPSRIECYDNSHIMGTNMVGAMIVMGAEGFRKNGYRKFNIKRPETIAGDDFGMMREVLQRRFERLEKEDPDRRSGGMAGSATDRRRQGTGFRRGRDAGGDGRAGRADRRHIEGAGP